MEHIYKGQGKIKLKEDGKWVIWHRKDFDMCATDGGDVPVHPQHNLWLLIFGKDDKLMLYFLKDGFAFLVPSEPYIREYTQD
jgi:hypothetical protein